MFPHRGEGIVRNPPERQRVHVAARGARGLVGSNSSRKHALRLAMGFTCNGGSCAWLNPISPIFLNRHIGASGTTLAFPSMYRRSVVYSERLANCYVYLTVWGSDFMWIAGMGLL